MVLTRTRETIEKNFQGVTKQGLKPHGKNNTTHLRNSYATTRFKYQNKLLLNKIYCEVLNGMYIFTFFKSLMLLV